MIEAISAISNDMHTGRFHFVAFVQSRVESSFADVEKCIRGLERTALCQGFIVAEVCVAQAFPQIGVYIFAAGLGPREKHIIAITVNFL